MALYHMTVKVIGRSAGRSATAAAAYRAAEVVHDERTGETHDYRAKGNVAHTEILLPENAPEWMGSREKLWNGVERAEKRKDAQLAREVELAIPRELTREQQIALVRDFVREEFVARGMVADIAIHAPKAGDGQDQPHAHIMLTMRSIQGDGFGNKDRTWNDGERYVQSRARWADLANERLRQHGHEDAATLDHRSYADRDIDREATVHMGPFVAELERRGVKTDVGDLNRGVVERNTARNLARHALQAARAAVQGAQRTAEGVALRVRQAAEHLAVLRSDPAVRQAQRDRAFPESEVQGEWKRLFEQRFSEVKARAERLIQRCTAKGEHYRSLQARHIGRMPSPQAPTGWFSGGKVKAWEKERADWSAKNNALCASISHHEKRGVRLAEYTKSASPYDIRPSRGESLAAKILTAERPELAERKKDIDLRQKEREVAERRQQFLNREREKSLSRDRNKGRGR